MTTNSQAEERIAPDWNLEPAPLERVRTPGPSLNFTAA